VKLLIIEDEIDLGNALVKGFTKKGYLVDKSTDGLEGLELYRLNQYDLIILDLNLPTMDGLEILDNIRGKDKEQRVLILSARSAIDDRIIGLDMGANDYLPKPFDFRELDARVRSLLRCELIQHNNQITCGDLCLDTHTKKVVVKSIVLELEPREYSILEYLLFHLEKVISAETIIEHVWDSDADLFSSAVKVHMSNIRRKIKEACGKDYIVTVRGQGYMITKEEQKE